jgi:hypothetical protein
MSEVALSWLHEPVKMARKFHSVEEERRVEQEIDYFLANDHANSSVPV